MQVVPEGVDLIPPTQNVERLGQHESHRKILRGRLNYLFDMADGADLNKTA